MIQQTFVIHLVPDSVRPRIYLNQYDTGYSKLIFDIVDVNTYYEIPSGNRVLFIGTKQDKTMFSYACTYSGHRVTCDVTEQMTAVPGNAICELRFIGPNNIIANSINIDLHIERSPLEFGVLSENDFRSADEEIISIHAESRDAIIAAERAQEAYDGIMEQVDNISAQADAANQEISETADEAVTTVNNTVDTATTTINNEVSDGLDAISEALTNAIDAIDEYAQNGVSFTYATATNTLTIVSAS